MRHVDTLSRSVGFVNEMPIERELELRQLTDTRIQEIANNLEFAEDEKFALIDGLVYRRDGESLKFVIPDMMISKIIRAYHDDVAHCGQEETYQGINQNYWFPAMRKKIYDYVNNYTVQQNFST